MSVLTGVRTPPDSAVSAAAPSAIAEWVELSGAGPSHRRVLGLVGLAPDRPGLPSAPPPEAGGTIHVIAAPGLAVASGDAVPSFGITLTLERQPSLDERSLVPLVTGAVMSLTATVNPSQAELRSATVGERAAIRIFPLYTRFALVRAENPTTLTEVRTEGPGGVAALTLSLSRDDALDALRALDGLESSLALTADVGFRAVATALRPVRVTVDLARAHDRLGREAGPSRTIEEGDLPRLLATLIEQEDVRVESAPASAGAMDPIVLAAVLRVGLLRALLPILTRMSGGNGGSGSYRLGARPTDGSTISFEQRHSDGEVERTISLSRPLAELVHGLTDDRPLDAFVRAVCPASDGSLQPIAVRISTMRAAPNMRRATDLAAMGSVTASLPAVLRTSRGSVSALALGASDIAIRRPGASHAWIVNDLVIPVAVNGDGLQSLPVIDGEATLWSDRLDASRYWYAPEFAVVAPEPTSSAADSPYVFSFRVVGHDADGKPGLEATIRLTLRPAMSAATTTEWEAKGRPAAAPVPTNGLSLGLEIPFRGENGQIASQQIAAVDVSASAAEIVATFGLTDRWARLAYGALGVSGFQAQPARVISSYAFPAYVVVAEEDGRIAWGGKIATLPRIDRMAIPVGPEPDDPGPDWTTVDEIRSSPKTDAAAEASAASKAPPALHAAAHLFVHPLPPNVIVQPVMVAPVHLPPPKTYGIRTQGRTGTLDALLPCSSYGSLYVQAADPSAGDTGGEQAIGCRDAWTLGQVKLRLYEPFDVEIGVSDPGFTVHRSLQVPGRFLVVPRAYTIARYEPGDERAYRPAVYLFSTVDAVHPERSSCIVMATLRPAVTPANRRALLDALRMSAHPTPTLEWPTDLQVAPIYEWAIATGGTTTAQVVPAVARTPEGFQVSLATGIDGILQLKTILEMGGVHASVSFPLADGQSLQSTLLVDLGRIDGPSEAGAVDGSIAGPSATIVNRVERAADVGDVLVYADASRTASVPLERRLAPGESASFPIPTGATAVLPRYTLVAGPTTIDEVRTFVEDIYTNVAFKSTIDLAAAGLAGLTIEARVVGVAGVSSVSLDAAVTAAEAGFVLPLTTYLAHPTLQYRVTTKGTDGSQGTGEWHNWQLDTQGNVVEIATTS
jgi:hypothetical protein